MTTRYSLKGKELLTFGYCRLFISLLIPSSIMKLCGQFLQFFEFVPFSKQFKSSLISLENDNKIARVSMPRGWILCDMEPVKTGTHCWRIYVNNPAKHWIFWGLSAKKMFKNTSAMSEGNTVYGLQALGGKYIQSKLVKQDQFKMTGIQKFQVDMLLKCHDNQKDELQMCAIGHEDKDKYHVSNMIRPQDGWVIHFNLYDSNTIVSVIQIDPEMFSVKIGDLDQFIEEQWKLNDSNKTV
eukprot:403679_1